MGRFFKVCWGLFCFVKQGESVNPTSHNNYDVRKFSEDFLRRLSFFFFSFSFFSSVFLFLSLLLLVLLFLFSFFSNATDLPSPLPPCWVDDGQLIPRTLMVGSSSV